MLARRNLVGATPLAALPVAALPLFVLGSCEVTAPVRVDPGVDRALLDVRDAVGFSSLLRERSGLTLRGTRTTYDAEGAPIGEAPVALSFRPSGSFVLTVGGDPGGSARGFDGSEAWTSDARGIARVHALGSRARILADGRLRTLLWLADGDDRFRAEVNEAASDARSVVIDLRGPRAGAGAVVDVDRATMLPRGYTLGNGSRTTRTTNWVDVDGVRLPYTVEEVVDGRLLHRDEFVERTRGTPRTFAPPRSRPNDTAFDPETPAEVPARVDAGGRFYVRARLEGASDDLDDAWLLVDTGFGSHALDGDVAEALGASTAGAASLRGVGGKGTGTWRALESLSVGPLEHATPTFIAIDTAFLTELAGFPVAGVLGAPLFERAIVTLEEPTSRAWVYDPRTFPTRQVAWQPVVMDDTSPCVRGRVVHDRRATPDLWLRLDTGSDDTLTVARWAVREHDLEGDRSRLGVARISGVYGTVLGWRKAVDAIEFAGAVESHAAITLLREDSGGPLDDPWIAGNLGTRVLQGRRVVLDLGRARVAITGR